MGSVIFFSYHLRIRRMAGVRLDGRVVIGADDFADYLSDIILIGVRRFHEVFELSEELVRVERDGAADMDEVVFGLSESFLSHELFLVELLAGAEARIDDLDVDVGLEAAELYEVAGEGVDPDGAAHIEDEDLAAVGVGAGEHNERNRLFDRHKVTDDIGVGDGDGAALGDLTLEDRDDGAV